MRRETITVLVVRVSGEVFEVDMALSDTIQTVKKKIEESAAVESSQQRLIWAGLLAVHSVAHATFPGCLLLSKLYSRATLPP